MQVQLSLETQSKPDKAFAHPDALAETLYEFYPDYFPCLEMWVSCLSRHQQYEKIDWILNQFLLDGDTDLKIKIYKLQAKMAAKQHHFLTANFAEAQVASLSGDRQRAYHILLQISKSPKTPKALLQRTQWQLNDLRAMMKENKEAV